MWVVSGTRQDAVHHPGTPKHTYTEAQVPRRRGTSMQEIAPWYQLRIDAKMQRSGEEKLPGKAAPEPPGRGAM